MIHTVDVCYYGSYSNCSGIVSVSDMIGTFLFVWSTVCVATSEVNGCEDGWVEFTCKYPEANQNYKNIKVEGPRRKAQSSKKNEWEKKGRFSLYHDRKNKILRVVMKQLQQDDFGNYQCEFKQDSSEELDLGLYLVKGKICCICIKVTVKSIKNHLKKHEEIIK